jgi:hypothetical protein
MKTYYLFLLTLITMLTGCYHYSPAKFEDRYGYKLQRMPGKDTCTFLGNMQYVDQGVKITVTDSLKFFSDKTPPYYVNYDKNCFPYSVMIK